MIRFMKFFYAVAFGFAIGVDITTAFTVYKLILTIVLLLINIILWLLESKKTTIKSYTVSKDSEKPDEIPQEVWDYAMNILKEKENEDK